MCGALAPLDDSSVSILRFQRYDKFREIIAEKSELPGGALACPSAYRRVLDSTRSCGAGSAWHCHFATAVVNEKRSEEAWAISGEGRAPACHHGASLAPDKALDAEISVDRACLAPDNAVEASS